jgi:predicted HicB family RNase H-like nuclease
MDVFFAIHPAKIELSFWSLLNETRKTKKQQPQEYDVKTSSLQDNAFAASDEGKRMTLRIQKSGWVQLNLLHLEQGRTVNELITAAINDYLEKHGNSPVA